VKADELWSKARQAMTSARLLLDAGDTSGACNRAYYAMFDSARAASLTTEANVSPGIGKTHSGLIQSFSQHLVKPAWCPRNWAKALPGCTNCA